LSSIGDFALGHGLAFGASVYPFIGKLNMEKLRRLYLASRADGLAAFIFDKGKAPLQHGFIGKRSEEFDPSRQSVLLRCEVSHDSP